MNDLSRMSLRLEMRWNGNELATGTGFLMLADGGQRTFLVTNRHNVTGRHQQTGDHLSSHGVGPDELRVTYCKRSGLGDATFSLPLEGTNPWIEHPVYGSRADVVLIEIPFPPDALAYDLNAAERAEISVAADLSIIGYPLGATAQGTAVRVRGVVASEPELGLADLPTFLIDSRTRKGQSGSPVVFYRRDGALPTPHGTIIVGGEYSQLVGVYSGRISDESDLGIVWPIEMLREMIPSV